MNIKKVGKINGCQDGAIYNSILFRLDHLGNCSVYDLKELRKGEGCELTPLDTFKLDKHQTIVPHSNAVTFGCDFYKEDDEFPLLYSNIYNNYKNSDDKLLGVCCVYRIKRENNNFSSELVQLIEIGFCEDVDLWKATPEAHGERPFGNFVVDRDSKSYYAIVMKNEQRGTTYLKFDLPSVHEGKTDERFGIKKVVLSKNDIKDRFDLEFHRFIQGAAVHRGKVYSTEGFYNDAVNRPAIRVIDLENKDMKYIDILSMGYKNEPEFIDFYGDACYYSDVEGNIYTLEI